MTMKIVVRNSKKERHAGRGELEIDVGGLTEYEAEDFVDEVKRRVKIRSRSDRRSTCEGKRGGPQRQVIDVNINVRE